MAAQRAGVCASAFHPRAAAAIDLLLHAAARVVDLDLCRARAGRRVGIETPRGGRRLRAGIGRRGIRRVHRSQSATTGDAWAMIPLAAPRRPAQGIARRGRGHRATRSGAAEVEAPAGTRATPDPVPEPRVGGEAGIVIQRRRRATRLDRKSLWSPREPHPI